MRLTLVCASRREEFDMLSDEFIATNSLCLLGRHFYFFQVSRGRDEPTPYFSSLLEFQRVHMCLRSARSRSNHCDLGVPCFD